MKRKSTQAKIPTSKIILFSSIFFAVGIFILFFSFLSTVPSSDNDRTVVTEDSQKPTVVPMPSASDDGSTTELVMAPRPDLADEQKPQVQEPVQVAPPTLQPKPDPIVPPVKTKDGKIVFIFDDGGHQISHSKPFVDLPFPITIAVLPQLADSVETAELVRESGNELFLHQPMQAMNLTISPGPGAILPDMTTGEAVAILRKNVAEIGPVIGVNNHEGSLITSDRNLIGAVIDACDDLGVLFLDSRTTAQTAVPMVALERGIEVLDRDIFIDNEKDKAYMRDMIEKGLEIADKQGYVIMIGHVTTPFLAPLLEEMYSELSAQGYTFTTPSKLRTQ